MTNYNTFIGIDVGKDHLDLYCHPQGTYHRFDNTRKGIADLIDQTSQETHGSAVAYGCEATGGYEAQLLIELFDAGLDGYCLHPADVRAFARFKGKRAKTDRLDAKTIADALNVAVAHRKPIHKTRLLSKIRELALLRRQLSAMATQLKSLQSAMLSEDVTAVAQNVIDGLKLSVKSLEKAIQQTIRCHPQTARKAEQIMSVPGAGPILACELVASMPELGKLSGKQAASLIGVAPHPRQSGRSSKNNRCQGGRAQIRKILYMAALSAIKACKEPFIGTYQRLRQNGKPFKVAIIAIMRKMITIINAIIKTATIWEENHAIQKYQTTVA